MGSIADSVEPWRLRRCELRFLLNAYQERIASDVMPLARPSRLERHLIGDKALLKRIELIRRGDSTNTAFVEAVVADLPEEDVWSICNSTPERPAMAVINVEKRPAYLSPLSYGNLNSLFLHLMRDWSEKTEAILNSTYAPALAELQTACPAGGSVLVPGAGLCRLAVEAAALGFSVEANEASRLFCTVAEYVVNRAPVRGHTLLPMAHLFQENWSLQAQYLEVDVPAINPRELLRTGGSFALAPGDFSELYAPDGPRHRKFNAILTCFFLDALVDLAEFIGLLDLLLEEGGTWVNIGPLHFNSKAKLKLSWQEIAHMTSVVGFDFKLQRDVICGYHLPKGVKMFSEGYCCVLSVAVKRPGGPGSPPGIGSTPFAAREFGGKTISLPGDELASHSSAGDAGKDAAATGVP